MQVLPLISLHISLQKLDICTRYSHRPKTLLCVSFPSSITKPVLIVSFFQVAMMSYGRAEDRTLTKDTVTVSTPPVLLPLPLVGAAMAVPSGRCPPLCVFISRRESLLVDRGMSWCRWPEVSTEDHSLSWALPQNVSCSPWLSRHWISRGSFFNYY